MTEQSITKELLNELFEYKDGELYRKIVRSNRNTINDEAGYINPNGYKVININGCIPWNLINGIIGQYQGREWIRLFDSNNQ